MYLQVVIPPPDSRKVDVVGRLFGGTVREKSTHLTTDMRKSTKSSRKLEQQVVKFWDQVENCGT